MVKLYLSTFDISVEKVRLYFLLTNKNFRTTNTSIKRRIEAVTAPTRGGFGMGFFGDPQSPIPIPGIGDGDFSFRARSKNPTGSSKLLQLSFDPSDNSITVCNGELCVKKILVGFNELQSSSQLYNKLSHVVHQTLYQFLAS